MIQEENIREFVRQAHRVGEAGLTICSSGNLSWRIGDEALVSGTGSWVPTLTESQVSICRISDGTVLNGVKPSMESTFHLGVMRRRPDVGVVLHFQSPYATQIACSERRPESYNVTAEVPLHVGRVIPEVPFFCPGSPNLQPQWWKPSAAVTAYSSCSTAKWCAARTSTTPSSVPCSSRWPPASASSPT